MLWVACVESGAKQVLSRRSSFRTLREPSHLTRSSSHTRPSSNPNLANCKSARSLKPNLEPTSALMEAPLPPKFKTTKIEAYLGEGDCVEQEDETRVPLPFTREVLEAPLPLNFKMQKMEAYSGVGDPIEHLQVFRSWMDLQGVSEAFMCRAFPLTLTGAAQKWFMSWLRPGSIGSFTQLCKSFISHFIMGVAACDFNYQAVESPFTRQVLEAPLPPNFKMPQIKAYSGELGEGDHTEHLYTIRYWMSLYDVPGAIVCRTFSMTLSGAARKWFLRLRPGSIGSFTQLSKSFTSQFMSPLNDKKPVSHLLSVKQGRDEPLKDFMVRFNNEAMAYVDEEAAVIRAMISGLHINGETVSDILIRELLLDVAKEPPKSYTDLLETSCKYSNGFEQMVDDTIRMRHAEQGESRRSR